MVTKKAVAKKPVKKTAKKAVKKVTAKRTTKMTAAQMKSFKLYKDPKPFTSLKVTRQTAYWIALLLVIIFTQLWILQVQLDLAALTASLLENS